MICPNCGAEMERHAFTHVCSFCGHVIAANETIRPTLKEKNDSRYYDYIAKNLSYIQQSPHIEIVENTDSFVCTSAKPFYPNDGHYALDNSIAFWWHAKVTKHGVAICLLMKSRHLNSCNHICFKVKDSVFTFKQDGELLDKLVFPMKLDDFLLLSKENTFEFDTNLSENAYQKKYDEFTTYTRRFYHLLLDSSKFRYALNTELLTD